MYAEPREQALAAIANYGAVRARLRSLPQFVRVERRPVHDMPPNPPAWWWLGELELIPTSLPRAHFILRKIALEYDLTMAELMAQRRLEKIIRARHHAIWLISKHTIWSLPQIGRFFGGQDHTTALNAIRKHQARVDAAEARK